MNKILLGLLLLFSASRAVDTLSIPTDFNTVSSGTRANLSGDLSAIGTWAGKIRDTTAQVTSRISGYTGTLLISSLSNLRLKLDADNSETARLLVESGTGDSLFRISEDSTAKFFGPLTVANKIAADSLSISGLTASQPVWTDATKKLVSNAPTGTGTTLVLSASPTGTGTWSLPILNISGKTTLTDSLVGVAERLAGNLTLSNGTSGGPSINLNSTDIGGRNFVMASGGSANGAFRVGGWNLRDATAGVTRIIVDSLGATTFAGSVEAVGTLAADGQFAFAGNGSGTTAALWRDATNGINMRGIAGSANQLELWDKNGAALLSFSNSSGAATFPNAVSMSSTLGVTGVATFTAPPVFSSVTASQILSVDGSKGLTSTATTGTGSVMLAASPTTTGTLTAAAITASGTVTADTLVSSKLYTEGTFSGTITGCSSPPTPTFSYARMGKIVVIKIPAITCTSNATIFSIDGIPAGLRPGLTTDIPATSLVDGSTVRSVVGTIEVAGPTMSFFTTANSAGTWTASGNKGTNFVTFLTYTLQ